MLYVGRMLYVVAQAAQVVLSLNNQKLLKNPSCLKISPEISMDRDEARSKNLRLLGVRAFCTSNL